MAKPVILVTGLGGLIGSAIRAHLGDRYEFRGLGRRSGPPNVPWHVADVSNLDAILPVFDGVHAVVHLAAVVGTNAEIDAYVRTNIVGTYNVFEAARRKGIRRIVYASSGATIGGVERDEPYRSHVAGDSNVQPVPVLNHESPLRPSSVYGCSKSWGEGLARY